MKILVPVYFPTHTFRSRSLEVSRVLFDSSGPSQLDTSICCCDPHFPETDQVGS